MMPTMTVRIGSRSRADLCDQLSAHGVGLNAFAAELLAHPAFDETDQEQISVTACRVEGLGYPDGAPLPGVFDAVTGLGLSLCPLVTGPYLRLALLDQASAPDSVIRAGKAPTGALTIASLPPSEDHASPKGFYLRTVDGRPWLRGYRCDYEHVFSPKDTFIVRLPDDHRR